MFVIYCHLVNIWVAGLVKVDGKTKVRYAVRGDDAITFHTHEKAKKVYDHLPLVWKPHCEIMQYARSAQIHDDFFAKGV